MSAHTVGPYFMQEGRKASGYQKGLDLSWVSVDFSYSNFTHNTSYPKNLVSLGVGWSAERRLQAHLRSIMTKTSLLETNHHNYLNIRLGYSKASTSKYMTWCLQVLALAFQLENSLLGYILTYNCQNCGWTSPQPESTYLKVLLKCNMSTLIPPRSASSVRIACVPANEN